MMKSCHTAGFLAIVALLVSTPTLRAAEQVSKGLFTENALSGYDPVAYFTEGRPVKGSPDYIYHWHNATWFFASAEHRNEFRDHPESFAPQYGGYSAAALADGRLERSDPTHWQIFQEKLYLNDPASQMTWQQNIPQLIKKADENWPKMVE
jgi:YHS domain-containing protein